MTQDAAKFLFGFPSQYWFGLALCITFSGLLYAAVRTIWGRCAKAEGDNMISLRLKRDRPSPWDSHPVRAEPSDWCEVHGRSHSSCIG